LSAARNAGIHQSRGDIVAFTDDDVVVHPRWLGALRDAFREPEVMAVTGLVLPAELETRAQYIFQTDALGWTWGYRSVEFNRTFVELTKPLGIPAWRLGAGANMAFRRIVFDRVGLFDERLGAGASGCSEDSELWYRLLAEDHICRYDPAAVVFHYHRPDWGALSNQMYSYMRGHVAALFFQFERYGHWGNLYRAFLVLPGHLVLLTLRALKRRVMRVLYQSSAGSLSVGPQVRGVLAGYRYYLRHRSRRRVGQSLS
jgi:GT2 family glycosyltransferase